MSDVRDYDEAVEALRQGLNSLPRYSFMFDGYGNILQYPDRAGRWIDWQSAHELFDPVKVDALLAKLQAARAIVVARKGAS